MPLFNFPHSAPSIAVPQVTRLEAMDRVRHSADYIAKWGLTAEAGRLPSHIEFRKLPNLSPCTEDDFWSHRISYNFAGEIWLGQQEIEGSTRWGSIMLYLVEHGHRALTGFAIVHRYSYPAKVPVEYYTWGKCMHTFQQKNIGNCLNRYTCTKCGHFYDVDSSD